MFLLKYVALNFGKYILVLTLIGLKSKMAFHFKKQRMPYEKRVECALVVQKVSYSLAFALDFSFSHVEIGQCFSCIQ